MPIHHVAIPLIVYSALSAGYGFLFKGVLPSPLPLVVANFQRMIKTLIRCLFLFQNKRNEIIQDLECNPNFGSNKEVENDGAKSAGMPNFKLEKGKVQRIFTPDLGEQKGLTVTKWYFKTGDIVQSGEVVCDIENANIVMEFESCFNGRIFPTCQLNEMLTSETELFKIEGI